MTLQLDFQGQETTNTNNNPVKIYLIRMNSKPSMTNGEEISKVAVHFKGDSFDTTVYRKPTHTGEMLNFNAVCLLPGKKVLFYVTWILQRDYVQTMNRLI